MGMSMNRTNDDIPADLTDQPLLILVYRWKRIAVQSLLAAILATGIVLLIPPTFTARTTFLAPQGQQSSSAAASALASLSAISSLAGGIAGFKTPADQLASLMLSVRIVDRIIAKHDLQKVYDKKYLSETRREFERSVRIAVGKKDGIITVEVDDESPERAAAIANSLIDELRTLTGTLALTESQQRRKFFEKQLEQVKVALADAQAQLQKTGFDVRALRSEPRAAAESYAKLKAEVVSATVKLNALRSYLGEGTAEVRQAVAILAALQAQLTAAENATAQGNSDNYVSAYRDFKYQEQLFELLSKQYEFARLDESRDNSMIQVIDTATPPDKRAKPKRALLIVVAALISLIALSAYAVLAELWLKPLWMDLRASWRRSTKITQ